MEVIPFKRLQVLEWGLLAYGEAFERQLALVEDRIAGISPDRLVLVEHPHVITIGRSGGLKDLRISREALKQKGVEFYQVDRGGMATFHGPGQLVAYPIIKLQQKDLHHYLRTLLQTVAAVLRNYGLKPELKEGSPGIWVGSNKIACVGIAVRRWVIAEWPETCMAPGSPPYLVQFRHSHLQAVRTCCAISSIVTAGQSP